MTKLFFFLCFGLALNGHCAEDPEFSLVGQKTIRQFQEGLWGVEIHEGIYGVVEQVTEENKESWINYFTVQNNPRVVSFAATYKSGIQKGSIGNGAGYAKSVLENTRLPNQNYIAYITSNPVLRPTDRHSYFRYSADDIEEVRQGIWVNKKEDIEHWIQNRDITLERFSGNRFARDIKMYVTITTSPDALITSHMGITATAESVLTGRPKNISITLHALAARVMQEINPKKQYMLTVPVHHMTMLLARALPTDLFYGTIEEKRYVDEADEKKARLRLGLISFGVYTTRPPTCDYPEVLEALKTFWINHPPRVSVDTPERPYYSDLYRPKNHLKILAEDGHPLLEISREDPTYAWLFKTPFDSDLGNRYVLIPLGALSSLFPLPERHLARDGAHSPTAEGGGGSGAGSAGYERRLA